MASVILSFFFLSTACDYGPAQIARSVKRFDAKHMGAIMASAHGELLMMERTIS